MKIHRSRFLCIFLLGLMVGELAYSQAPTAHRFGVRVASDGTGEFYDTTTGQTFTPRGNNYVRLAMEPRMDGGSDVEHSTFIPGAYDPVRTENALATMQASGYNVVRVFLSPFCVPCLGNSQGPGLNPAYIANLADFITRAKNHNVSVIIATDAPPDEGGYTTNVWQNPTVFAGENARYLTPEGVQSDQMFWHDFVKGLVNAGAPTDDIFSYELRNELFFQSNVPPLSLTSGVVTTANGTSYDMSSAAAQQQMMQDGLVFWFNAQASAIKSLDPTALVASGFFDPQGPNPDRIGDTRLIEPYPAVGLSSLDFADLHAYPGEGLTLPQIAQNYGFGGYSQKPVLMGESGAFRNVYNVVSDAAQALQQWQVDSCPLGFKGWLTWTWDTDEQPQIWTAIDVLGQINAALSPVNRPNPCTPYNTVTQFSTSPNPSFPGQQVQLTASVVTSGATIATGTINFLDATGQTSVAQVPLQFLRNLAVGDTSSLSSGLHWLQAQYGGDTNDTVSNSIYVGQLVSTLGSVKSSTTLSVVSQPPFRVGQLITVSARVSLSNTHPNVSLYDGSTLLGTSSTGRFSVSLPFGSHSLTAVFFGDRVNRGSVSSPVQVYVFN